MPYSSVTGLPPVLLSPVLSAAGRALSTEQTPSWIVSSLWSCSKLSCVFEECKKMLTCLVGVSPDRPAVAAQPRASCVAGGRAGESGRLQLASWGCQGWGTLTTSPGVILGHLPAWQSPGHCCVRHWEGDKPCVPWGTCTINKIKGKWEQRCRAVKWFSQGRHWRSVRSVEEGQISAATSKGRTQRTSTGAAGREESSLKFGHRNRSSQKSLENLHWQGTNENVSKGKKAQALERAGLAVEPTDIRWYGDRFAHQCFPSDVRSLRQYYKLFTKLIKITLRLCRVEF